MRLTEDDARARLSAAPAARLATTGADRQPHLVPVTFAVDGELIYIAVDHKPKTTMNLRRLRNIAENPLVAVLADHYAPDWTTLWWVRADGDASIIAAAGDEDARSRPLDLLAARYEQYREHRPAGPVIVIRVRRWIGWSGQADRETDPH